MVHFSEQVYAKILVCLFPLGNMSEEYDEKNQVQLLVKRQCFNKITITPLEPLAPEGSFISTIRYGKYLLCRCARTCGRRSSRVVLEAMFPSDSCRSRLMHLYTITYLNVLHICTMDKKTPIISQNKGRNIESESTGSRKINICGHGINVPCVATSINVYIAMIASATSKL